MRSALPPTGLQRPLIEVKDFVFDAVSLVLVVTPYDLVGGTRVGRIIRAMMSTSAST